MTETKRAAALGAALANMFKRLEQRPVPDAIKATVDQLDAEAAEAARPTPARGTRRGR